MCIFPENGSETGGSAHPYLGQGRGFCNLNIISCTSCIGCDKTFYADAVCLNMKESLINALLDNSDGAINFLRFSCLSSYSQSQLNGRVPLASFWWSLLVWLQS